MTPTPSSAPGIRHSQTGSIHLVDHLSPSRRSQVVIAIGVLASAAAYPRFPNGYLPTFYWPIIALFLPMTAGATLFAIQSLWNRDSIRDRDPEAQANYDAIMFRVVVFVIGLHGLLLAALAGMFSGRTWAPRTVLILFGVSLVSVGNLLPRTTPNLELGIRTRRTLTDRILWMSTHRFGGHLLVAFGLLTAISGLFFSKTAIEQIVGPAGMATLATWFLHYRWQSRT